QPMDRKFKHSYVGKKPHRHVFGLARLRKMHKAGLDKLNDQIQEAYDQGNDYAARDLEVKLDNYKLESVFICSGGSDGLNLASLGYNAIWYNSEAEQLNFEEWKELKSLCHNVYNLPDI